MRYKKGLNKALEIANKWAGWALTVESRQVAKAIADGIKAEIDRVSGEYIIIKLDIPGTDPITLDLVEAPTGLGNPLARVRYSVDGVRQDDGLRFDMGKCVFIDHLEDDNLDAIVKSAEVQVLDAIVREFDE